MTVAEKEFPVDVESVMDVALSSSYNSDLPKNLQREYALSASRFRCVCTEVSRLDATHATVRLAAMRDDGSPSNLIVFAVAMTFSAAPGVGEIVTLGFGRDQYRNVFHG